MIERAGSQRSVKAIVEADLKQERQRLAEITKRPVATGQSEAARVSRCKERVELDSIQENLRALYRVQQRLKDSV